MESTNCPDRLTLQDVLLGKCAAEELNAILVHLQYCPQCAGLGRDA